MNIDVKDLLTEIQPLVRAKAQIKSIDKKISTLSNNLKGLKSDRSKLENSLDDADLMNKLEDWADSLPKDIVKNGNINRLLTALEYLNK